VLKWLQPKRLQPKVGSQLNEVEKKTFWLRRNQSMVVEETTNGIILVYGLFYCYIDLMALLCSYLYHFLFSAKYI
jgi:hypothetical protein